MAEPLSRDNHYVPQWYQRTFLSPGATELYRLDLQPKTVEVGNGTTKLLDWPVRRSLTACFVERDLYTTRFGAIISDEIERQLFGMIDTNGSRAVRAYVGGDPRAMHDAFEDLFEYVDAQKLRTPRGLDWIKARYPRLDQAQLMQEMQSLRLMHCTMWAEGVREIVSAANSDVKFIVSDHPVTVYNPSYSPASTQCTYPNDPSIALLGTQTIFALDRNTCLIFTHLECATSPNDIKPTKQRTFARFRGHGLVRTDAFVRTRSLSRDEVIAINFLLKSRAGRFIASSEKAWLYPERSFSGAWSDIAKVLLPRDELWKFGGEIYVGYKDGSVHYQDAFGRTSGADQYLRKERQDSSVLNDLCGCGSGKKYRRCCHRVPTENRASWSVLSIRERNLALCRAIQDILGLDKGKSWEDVRRELSADQVARINEFYARTWPSDTDLVALLPRKTPTSPRALYLGLSDPRTVASSVLAWLPYFGEIILAHPFVNAEGVKPDFSPVKSAAKHRDQTLKNVFFMLLLEPFIHAGIIHLIPDPADFGSQFRSTVMRMAGQRARGIKLHKEDRKRGLVLGRDDFKRTWLRTPDNVLRRQLKESQPDLTPEYLDRFLEFKEQQRLADPLALLQNLESGEAGAQFTTMTGFSLESALYLSALTGSMIYTDMRTHWEQLLGQARSAGQTVDPIWKDIAASLSSFRYPLALEPQALSADMRAGRLARAQRPLSIVMDSLHKECVAGLGQNLNVLLPKAVAAIHQHVQRTCPPVRALAKVEVAIPNGGFDRIEVRRLLLTYGRAELTRPVPMAMFVSVEPDMGD